MVISVICLFILQ